MAKNGSNPITTSDEPTLNDRQKQIVQYIKEYIYSKGFPPSVREIGKAVGLSSSASVHANLHKLVDLGVLSCDPDKPRTLSLTEDAAWRQKTMVPVPLVGAVHAGEPILAVENIEETYPLP